MEISKMTNLRMTMMAAVLTCATVFAAPGDDKTGPAKWGGKDASAPAQADLAARHARLKYVVEIAEALELNEADALKLSEKLKGLEERRQPVRQAMHQAMKAVKAAADGDAAALKDVDANVQQVLDGRAQMAVMDKELFTTLSKDLSPQQRAKLAVVLAKIHGDVAKKGRRAGR
jgi:pantothenate synthetase